MCGPYVDTISLMYYIDTVFKFTKKGHKEKVIVCRYKSLVGFLGICSVQVEMEWNACSHLPGAVPSVAAAVPVADQGP